MNRIGHLMLGMMAALGAQGMPPEAIGEREIVGINRTGQPFEPTERKPYKRPKQFTKKRRR